MKTYKATLWLFCHLPKFIFLLLGLSRSVVFKEQLVIMFKLQLIWTYQQIFLIWICVFNTVHSWFSPLIVLENDYFFFSNGFVSYFLCYWLTGIFGPIHIFYITVYLVIFPMHSSTFLWLILVCIWGNRKQDRKIIKEKVKR